MSELDQFILKNYGTKTNEELAKEVNEKFGTSYHGESLRSKFRYIRFKIPKTPKILEKKEEGEEELAKTFTEQLHEFLKTRNQILTVEELSDHFNTGISKVRSAMEELAKQGSNIRIISGGVELSRDIPKSEPTRIDVNRLRGKTIRFGLTSDNHLGSKYCRLDVLNALYDIWEREGITDVYQCGNMIDGEARFNKFDIIAHGIQGQADYFVENWPKRKGMNLHFVTGDDHEGWYVQREGVNIGQILEDTAKRASRDDLHYLGHMEHDIVFQGEKSKVIMRLIHAGGGSAYATSYSVQKIVESYQGGEKPNILLVGHYHKAEYGYPREVHVVQAGCTQDQTPFMRKLKIQAHVGGWIVEFSFTPEGSISRFKTEWIPFYDLNFYKRWKYNL